MPDEVELELEVELVGGEEGGRAREQIGGRGGSCRTSARRPAAVRRASRRQGQRPVDRQSELGAVAAGLLEVVTEDFVQLGERAPC